MSHTGFTEWFEATPTELQAILETLAAEVGEGELSLKHTTVALPDEMAVELEYEHVDGDHELELEVEWADDEHDEKGDGDEKGVVDGTDADAEDHGTDAEVEDDEKESADADDSPGDDGEQAAGSTEREPQEVDAAAEKADDEETTVASSTDDTGRMNWG